MADRSFDCEASNLLCTETSNLCFDDLDPVATDEQTHQNNDQNLGFGKDRSGPSIALPSLSEETFCLMVESERKRLPRDDYLERLRSGELDLSVRREAIDWISKAHAHYSFGALSFCLSVNYLDRFLSFYELPRGQSWISQLVAVACLSLASKVEEIEIPLLVDLQVGEPKFLFEAKTIQRMEILVLATLEWRMQVLTPLCFIDYFLRKIQSDHHHPLESLMSRSIQFILGTIKGIDFLEFRPSEIAAAVAMHVLQPLDIDTSMSCFKQVDKGRVVKCVEMIKDLRLIGGNGAISWVPQSPIGVLEAACFSYRSGDERAVGSCPSSSHSSPEKPKRRKIDMPSSLSSSFKGGERDLKS